MARKRYAVAIATALLAVCALAADTMQASSVPELWLGALSVGVAGGIGAFFSRSIVLVVFLALGAVALCWVPWVPAFLFTQFEAQLGSNYNMHAQLSKLLAPVIVAGGGALGHLRRMRARAT
jgi:hypothetical protein